MQKAYEEEGSLARRATEPSAGAGAGLAAAPSVPGGGLSPQQQRQKQEEGRQHPSPILRQRTPSFHVPAQDLWACTSSARVARANRLLAAATLDDEIVVSVTRPTGDTHTPWGLELDNATMRLARCTAGSIAAANPTLCACVGLLLVKIDGNAVGSLQEVYDAMPFRRLVKIHFLSGAADVTTMTIMDSTVASPLDTTSAARFGAVGDPIAPPRPSTK